MTTEPQLTLTGLHMLGLENLRKRWGWFLALGALLIVLGTVALGTSVFMTLATMVFAGWLLVVGGSRLSVQGLGRVHYRPVDRNLVGCPRYRWAGKARGRATPFSTHGRRMLIPASVVGCPAGILETSDIGGNRRDGR